MSTHAAEAVFRIPPRFPHRLVHTAVMGDVVYMVRAKSRTSCQRELDLMCRRLGARALTLPTDAIGPGWVARAEPDTTKAPAATDDGRGAGVSG